MPGAPPLPHLVPAPGPHRGAGDVPPTRPHPTSTHIRLTKPPPPTRARSGLGLLRVAHGEGGAPQALLLGAPLVQLCDAADRGAPHHLQPPLLRRHLLPPLRRLPRRRRLAPHRVAAPGADQSDVQRRRQARAPHERAALHRPPGWQYAPVHPFPSPQFTPVRSFGSHPPGAARAVSGAQTS